jgi:hypothetical protein
MEGDNTLIVVTYLPYTYIYFYFFADGDLDLERLELLLE